jgi:predicted class III extradiol MEMO1 family dioxygenase
MGACIAKREEDPVILASSDASFESPETKKRRKQRRTLRRSMDLENAKLYQLKIKHNSFHSFKKKEKKKEVKK